MVFFKSDEESVSESVTKSPIELSGDSQKYSSFDYEKYNLIFGCKYGLPQPKISQLLVVLQPRRSLKMKSLESLALAQLLEFGELSGDSPTPVLPPILRQNVQQVLVESPG